MQPIEFLRNDIFYLGIDAAALCLALACLAVYKRSYTAVAIFSLTALLLKLIVFVGFRPFDAGNDTIGYYETFQALRGIFDAREVGGMYGGTEQASELLYWPFAAFLKMIFGESFRLFLIVSILLCSYMTYWGNRGLIASQEEFSRREIFALSVVLTYLVFLSFEIVYFGGHIRSAFGIPLSLLAYNFAVRKRVLSMSVALFLAVGFHTSAIIVLPLLLIELVTPEMRRTRGATVLILVVLLVCFIFGRAGGIGSVMTLIGGYYAERYRAYVAYENFNITSVYATVYFWIILAHVLSFLIIGYRKVHFYAFYFLCLIFVFSPTPKISERFFAYVLICLPFLLFLSLRTRFTMRTAIALTVGVSFILAPLVVTSYAVTSTLSINSYIYPR
ncbi:EpsG family protein [Enterobacterales bacterium BD_CKDN230030183-1A_HGKHYDSX7]